VPPGRGAQDCAGKVSSMQRRSDPIRVELELRSRDDRVEGWISDSHGERLQFSSWLELMAALRTLVGRAPAGSRNSKADEGVAQAGPIRREAEDP
jgi:hypothetical protein